MTIFFWSGPPPKPVEPAPTIIQSTKHQPTKPAIITSTTHYSIPSDGILPGGRLSHFLHNWEALTSHRWPLSVIRDGYQIPLHKKPTPWKLKKVHLNSTEQEIVNEAIHKFMMAGIIEKSPTQSCNYLSNFFTIQEKTKHRPILDCQVINQYIQCQHFKMEGIPALREIIQERDLICKIDLKDVYVVVPIHPASRQYLSFQNHGQVYQYKTLAFGMSVSPRIFSKLMRYAMEPLRQMGVRLVYYLDDICLLAQSVEEMNQITHTVLQHLEPLGFLINKEKSILTPQYSQEFLGFNFNTKKMHISVPMKKISKLISKVKQAIQPTFKSCRWYAGIMGKMTSMIPAIGDALLHIRYLQRDLARTLKIHHQNWDSKFQLSQEGKQELEWWLTHIQARNGLPIRKVLTQPKLTIHVDASDTGWGITSTALKTTGQWTAREREQSINVRELTAILFALKLHAQKFQNSHIRIFTDNMTALKYSARSGGTASPLLQDLAIQIQEICNKYQLNVDYQHVPGVQNVQADALSRQHSTKIPLYETTLPRRVFRQLNKCWGPFKIDAFATRINAQLQQFWSIRPDPDASAQDAFQQAWTKKGMYLFPPWKLIPQVLHQITNQRIQDTTLITPHWTTQYWFPMILKMKYINPPLMFQLGRWKMIAWRLFTTRGKNLV